MRVDNLRRLTGMIAVTLLVTITAACGGGGTNGGSSAKGARDHVVIGAVTGPNNLDPASFSDVASYHTVPQTYDPLLRYDPTTKDYTPFLAVEWAHDDKATSFTFKLRDGVTFHDGSSLTAEGVVKAFKRVIEIGKGPAYLLLDVKDVVAAGPMQVRIDLKSPDAIFLAKLGLVYIPSEKAMDEHAGSDMGESWFANNEAGSGPYRVTDYAANNKTVLEKYDDYWREWPADSIDKFEITQADPTAQMLGLRNGIYDFGDAVSIQDLASIKDGEGLTVYDELANPMWITYNMQSKALSDIRIREAIALSVPYDDIISDVMRGFAAPLGGPTPSFMIGSLDAPPGKTDLDRAGALIKEAGYGPDKPLKVSLIYFSGLDFEKTVATVLQDNLRPLGVDLSVDGLDWPTLAEKVGNPDTRPDMGILALSAPTPDVGPTLLSSFDPINDGSWSYWGYNNQETIEMLRAAGRMPTEEQAVEGYRKVQSQLMEEFASIWLMEYPPVLVGNSELKIHQYEPMPAFDFFSTIRTS